MKKLLLPLFAVLLLAGCGGGDTLTSIPASSASSGSSTSSANSSATASVAFVRIVSNVATMPSDGSSNATLTAFVSDANHNALDGVAVAFVASSGLISSGGTTSGGAVTATLKTAGDTSLRTITVSAVAGGIATSTTVQVVSASSTATVQLGSGTGASFRAGVLDMGVTGTLSAGGTTVITATLVQSDGSLYTGTTNVTFSSPCIAASTAAIQEGNTISTTTGSVSATYLAKGCTSDTVTAKATVGGSSLSATGTLTIAQAAIGSIIFVSATPSSIALKGAGSTSMPETSRVKFQVLDSQNSPVANSSVTFALNTNVGGVALTATSAISDSNGYVTAIVNSGTVATSVRVTATVSSSIATQSSNLTITTGLPTQNNFSLAFACSNVEGWNYDGVTTTATVHLSDRYNNPVPDGTAITFQAEGGQIGGQCATASGACTVTWTSADFRPSNGRVSVLATAIGEESFVDVNGNGKFDSADTFTDMGEPFEDDNENGSYTSGEPFKDFYNTGQANHLAGARDGADGFFNGICATSDSALCSSISNTAAIGLSKVIVMSGSGATINVNDAAYTDGVAPTTSFTPINFITTPAPALKTYYISVLDLHGNPLPAGTVVSITNSNGTLSGTTSFTIGCTAQSPYVYTAGTTLFLLNISKDTTSSTGTVTINVTTPKGTVTSLDIPVID